MPTNLPTYDVPEKPLDDALLDAFLRVDEALSKLEERARLSPLWDAWANRLLYRNACAAMHTQNCLVYLEDLVLLDGHAFAGSMYPDLSCGLSILKLWQRGLQQDPLTLLQAPMPGEMPRPLSSEVVGDPMSVRDRPDFFYDPDWDQAGRIDRWRRVWRVRAPRCAALAPRAGEIQAGDKTTMRRNRCLRRCPRRADTARR